MWLSFVQMLFARLLLMVVGGGDADKKAVYKECILQLRTAFTVYLYR